MPDKLPKKIFSARKTRSRCRSKATAAARARFGRLLFEPLEPRLVLDAGLLISEFAADNDHVLADENGEYRDWIELHNPTAVPVDLDGWYLTDDIADRDKWQFPAVTIPSDGYLVVFASDKDRSDPAGQLHTNFKLSAAGEYLGLIRADGLTEEFAYAPTFPQQYEDVSYGLSMDLAREGYFPAPTPGGPNLLAPISDPTYPVSITEIMYHPASENDLEEYIELYNSGTQALDLEGWQIADGVYFTFPAVTLGAGEYLAVAASLDPQAGFSAKYPAVTNVVGGWTDHLSNSGEQIEIRDARGGLVDEVRYADEGDWADRELGPLDHTQRGWQWTDDHDGGGKSLELIGLAVSNDGGQNWAASLVDEGTPGAANSVAAGDIAPQIFAVEHYPIIPGSADPVTVTAELRDELPTGVTAAVHYRVDASTYDQNTYPTYAPASYMVLAMVDDGLHGDVTAGDGIHGAILPQQADGTVVEFFVSATDAGALTRTWPVPADVDGTPEQVANLLYQVDDSFDPEAQWVPGSQPVYRIIMTDAERTRLSDIGDGDWRGEAATNAQMNATFVSTDGGGMETRYNAGVRNRGHGSRSGRPNNYRVNFVNDAPWKNVIRLTINARVTHSQLIGSVFYRMAGLVAPDAAAVQVRVNGQNLARSYDSYVALEVIDGDFAEQHFPLDGEGNVYKCMRLDNDSQQADLRFEGENPDDYDPAPYRDTYFKMTNEDQDDWSDLIHLTDVLNNAPQETYFAGVSQVIDVEQWMRWLALDALMLNRETGLSRGIGDDYLMYSGVTDSRFVLIPHDLDSLMQLGASGAIDQTIWRADEVAGLNRLLNHADVTGLFYRAFVDLIDEFFNPRVIDPLVDQVLGPFVPQSTIDRIKNFVVARSAAVSAQIPQEFTVNSSLPVVDGYPHATESSIVIDGTADVVQTRSVLVDGKPADWNARTGQWQATLVGDVDLIGTILSFQQDASPAGYDGTVDTYIRGATPDDSRGAAIFVNVDGEDNDEAVHGLLRFDDIFGTGEGQVDPAAEIAGATLLLNLTNNGRDFALHRMLATWADTATWNSFGGDGIQADGVEAVAEADVIADGNHVGQISIDVTESILAWQANPESNHGWAMLTGNTNGLDFDSSENGNVANRPELRIELDDYDGPLPDLDLNPGINRIVVETFDGPDAAGELLEEGYVDVWYDPPMQQSAIAGEMLAAEAVLGGGPVISEFAADNDHVLADENGEYRDWIELHNPTAVPAGLDGWYLTDDIADRDKWQFPAVTIPPGEYLVVFASDKDRSDPAGQLHTNFKLSAAGEYLGLIRADGLTEEFAYSPTFPRQYEDVSYGLSMDFAAEGYFPAPTPGAANTIAPISDPTYPVSITEIMYHAASENVLEEYIEIYNRGDNPIGLNTWRFSAGVEFIFPESPDVMLGAGEYLVVAADLATFSAKYPTVTNVVGPWTGRLSNRSEAIEIVDANGALVDRVEYADQGDWSLRESGPLDHGHYGWQWSDLHDGGGRSLELINLAVSNDHGRNWAASLVGEGTPGAANSVATGDIAPLVLEVEHIPIIPGSTDPVTVTALLLDELETGVTATLYHRNDGQANFTPLAMLDDGLSGDGLAGDGIFAATLPARADGTIVEFYIKATDTGAVARTWPAPVPPPVQPGNVSPDVTPHEMPYLLYQVDDAFDPDAAWDPEVKPVYYLIMTETERAELEDVGNDGNAFTGEGRTDAQMAGTFISVGGSGIELHYNVGIRNRGNQSRVDPPNNYRVNFPHDQPFHGVTAINLNSKYAFSQVIGSAVFRLAGTAAPETAPVRVRVNGADVATEGNMYGMYAAVEVYDTDYADNHFPEDGAGNLYRCSYYGTPRTYADLEHKGASPYRNPDDYRDNYRKQTNEADDDWTDLFDLIDTLNDPSISDADFVAEVGLVVDVEQWMRFLATDALLGNREGGLYEGEGDDYAMYRGTASSAAGGTGDPRFRLLPHDLDTLLGEGDHNSEPDRNIFDYDGTRVGGLHRLLNHPETVSIYFEQYLDLIDTVFAPENFDPMIDVVLAGVAPQSTIDDMKQFVVDRTAYVLSVIPQDFTINSSLPIVDGYPHTSSSTTLLSGTASGPYTRSVLVGGEPAAWNARTGEWEVTGSGTGGGTVYTFQQGAGGYTGTIDTNLFQDPARAGTSFAAATSLNVDGDEPSSSGNDAQALVRFENIFGTGGGQVGPAAEIASATLLLNVTNNGNYFGLHRMLATWTDTATWNSFGNDGIQADDVQASATADVIIEGNSGPLSIDVTASILAWQAGPASNHGWAMLPSGTGTNGMDFDSSEGGNALNRPELRITLHDGGGGGGNGIDLNPGINRIVVETFDGLDGSGKGLESGHIDVWYDSPAEAPPVAAQAQAAQQQLEVIVRDGYLPGVPLLVRAEVHDDSGKVDRMLWDATVTLSVTDNPSIELSDTQITLFNGLGSKLVTVTAGSGPFTLQVTLDGGGLLQQSTLADLQGTAMTEVSGTLPGNTTWSGIIHVTSDLRVPSGTTLTIDPGTLILLDGVASGSGGTGIDVQGAVQSLGTAAQPVTFTAFKAAEAWGEIRHANADPSLYQYTIVTRGGHSPGGGHTGAGPVFRPSGSRITFDHVSITDADGKVMQSGSGSDLTFRNSLLARAVMGPEIDNTALVFEDTWITENHGPNDNDGIYIHSQSSTQTCTLRGGVIADMDDDGLDTLQATVLVEDYIFRDVFDKGSSVFGGEVTFNRVISVDNGIGISAKDGSHAVVHLDHATISGNTWGIQAENKGGGMDNGLVEYFVTNSIVYGNTQWDVRSDYPLNPIKFSFSDVGPNWLENGDVTHTDELWPGTGNLRADPLFVDPAGHDYHLLPGSPAVDAGDPDSPNDTDDTRTDQGYFGGGIGGSLAPQILPALIDEDLVLVPNNGPFQVNTNVTVAAGATMTILPGTTVFFDAGTSLTVRGRLLAEGTRYEQIRLTGAPGTASWGGIRLVDTMEDNRISYAVVEHCTRVDGMIELDNSNLSIDHVTLDHADRRRITSEDSSLIVRNSTFTDFFFSSDAPNNVAEHVSGRNIPAGGHFIIENNDFGLTPGHNDAIDFNAGHRAAGDPVGQILNNRFHGGGDDALDIEGDFHIEGNVFTHYRKDILHDADDAGESNVISAGDRPPDGHDYVVVRNVFYDVDHVALVKENSFMTFVGNTVVDVDQSTYSNVPGTIYFELAGQAGPGDGIYIDGSIFLNCETMFAEVLPETVIEVNRSIIDAEHHALGTGNLDEDPRVARPFGGSLFQTTTDGMAGGDFSLLPGSPALGTGPNGLDVGAMVPAGASISGEPPAQTTRDNATLVVGGPGVTHYMARVNTGDFGPETPVASPIVLAGLADGDYTVEVVGKDSAGVWQEEAAATVSKTWTVDASLVQLQINEVLALNTTAVEHEGTYPDLIELVNNGAATVDLAGMSISDNENNPRKFVFPADVSLAPGDYLVLYADDEEGTAALHLGFALDGDGEGVYLYDAAAAGGRLVDSVKFGPQAPDLSIGRVGQDGHWALTQPTPAAANLPQRTGNPAALKINEWLASGDVRFPNDFVELFNPDPLPVSLGGLHLTDNPVNQPAKHEIAPLTFVAGGGAVAFIADSNFEDGPNHLNFRLSADQELIGLYDADSVTPGNGAEIDKVLYFSQTTDYSQGRSPDGAAVYAFFPLPTPGMLNPNVQGTVATLIPDGSNWQYLDDGSDLGTAWKELIYPPADAWASGDAQLGYGDADEATEISFGPDSQNKHITTYFRLWFDVEDPTQFSDLTLGLLRDDGAVVYVNGGPEAFRDNMPQQGVIDYRTRPLENMSGTQEDTFYQHSIDPAKLQPGPNLIAVEIHQRDNSVDLSFDLSLEGTIPPEGDIFTPALNLLDGLRITEIMYNPVENDDLEFVELQNVGDATLDLAGVRLGDAVRFTFPPMLLAPGQFVVVVRDLEEFETFYGPGINVAGQYAGNLSNGGEDVVLQLAAPLDAAVLRFEYDDLWHPTTDGGGFSLEIADPATWPAEWSLAGSWQPGVIENGSPGTDDGLPVPTVVINEVLSHTDVPLVDSIELHNTNGEPVNIGGWYLSDSAGNWMKYRVAPDDPDNTTIAPHGYLVFDEGDFNPTPVTPGPNDFALDGAHGDDVWLVAANAAGYPTGVVDHVTFGAQKNTQSWGRWPDGSGPLYPMEGLPSLDGVNTGPRLGKVILSEIHYNPGTMDNANDLEFVEIYNSTGAPVDLSDWRLRKGVDFDFAGTVTGGDTVLGPNSPLVIVPFDPDAEPDKLAAFKEYHGVQPGVEIVGPYSGQLSDTGERVQLQRPDLPPADELDFHPGLLEDEAIYDDEGAWPLADGTDNSLNRAAGTWGNDAASWTAALPTPGVVESGPHVVGRYVFYNRSFFDGNDPNANATDDLAMATDKTALLPGSAATFRNYTSYSRGINGVMVDLAHLDDLVVPGKTDFQFRMGNDEVPGAWTPVTPSAVTVRPDAGRGGADRVTFVFDDNAVRNTWLEVTVLAGDLQLPGNDVFYFGNAIAESGNTPADARVATTDLLLARNNPRSLVDSIGVTFPYDYDRDGRVDATDVLLARNNRTSFLNELNLITPPLPAAEAAAAPDPAASEPAASELTPSELAWFAELAQRRGSTNRAPQEAAVDALLATYWQ